MTGTQAHYISGVIIDTTATSVGEKARTGFAAFRFRLVSAIIELKDKIVRTYHRFMNRLFATRPMQNARFRTFTIVFFQAMLWAMAIFSFYYATIYALFTLAILFYILTGMEFLSWLLACGIVYGIVFAVWSAIFSF